MQGSTLQPSASNCWSEDRHSSSTPGSNGRSGQIEPSQPIRWPCAQPIGSGESASGSDSVSDSGARSSQPDSVLSNRATSSTLRPIGPSVPSCWKNVSCAGTAGTRPRDGRMPTTLFHAAGFRSEPPKSLPSATGSIRNASATAAPPLLPPAERDGSYALRVRPKTGL